MKRETSVIASFCRGDPAWSPKTGSHRYGDFFPHICASGGADQGNPFITQYGIADFASLTYNQIEYAVNIKLIHYRSNDIPDGNSSQRSF